MHWAPGIPHALYGADLNAQLGRIAPRERETMFDEFDGAIPSVVIPAKAGIQYSRDG